MQWRDEFYVEIYQMLRDGRPTNYIARTLGVSSTLLNKWIATKPALKAAVKKATKVGVAAKDSFDTMKEFVHDRLPPEGRAYWAELEAVEKSGDADGREDVLERLTRCPRKTRQHLFLYALLHCNFVKTVACRKVGLDDKTLRIWMKEPGFRQIVEGIHEHKCDFFESSLVNLVRQGDSAATIFANRTLNRHRGYNDKVSVEVNSTVRHEHQLRADDLAPEVLRGLLEAQRAKKLALEDRSDVRDAEVVDG